MKKADAPEPFRDPPSFAQRAGATWVDFVLLLGAYLVLGAVSEHLFQRTAYPPASAMQLYDQRDFDVFVFFALSTVLLTTGYLLLCYLVFAATLGQRLAGIRLRNRHGDRPATGQILLRIALVLLRLFFILIPGPIAAVGFVLLGAHYLNAAFSMALLAAALLGILYCSIARYRSGHTTSATDFLTGTRLVRIASGPPPAPCA